MTGDSENKSCARGVRAVRRARQFRRRDRRQDFRWTTSGRPITIETHPADRPRISARALGILDDGP